MSFKREDSILYKFKKYIKSSIIVSISANLMIVPVMAYSMNTFSLTYIIPNILIGPLVFILEVLGIIYIFVPNFFILNYLIESILYLINEIALYCSKIPFSSVPVTSPNIIQIIIFYFCLLLLYLYFKSRINTNIKSREIVVNIVTRCFKNIFNFLKRNFNKIIIIVVIIILSFYVLENLIEKDRGINIYFIDVGQGDCTYIETKERKKVLIDGGGNEGYDIGENILKAYFLKRGIKKLDYIIISHLDYDHVGGIISLLDFVKTEKIILPIQFEKYNNITLLEKKIKETNSNVDVIFLEAGDRLFIDKFTYIDILWPNKEDIITENSINNNALVFNLKYNNFSMLFTGDIENEAEEKIIEQYREKDYLLKANILKVAHHGAETSSSEELIKMIRPQISLIGVGNNNNFGHPSSIVIKKLEKIKSIIYRTDIYGEIDIEVDGNGRIRKIETYNELNKLN